MLDLSDGLLLYHGSYCEVKEPDITKCAKNKDFGQGFYLTSSKKQAESFLNTSIIKAIAEGRILKEQNFGYISTFEVRIVNDIKVNIFKEADKGWLHCIAAHRKKNSFVGIEKEMDKYDVIVGKIADDATNAVLTAYISGVFGEIGSNEADEFCIKQLLPGKLKNQYCFKTDKALKCIKHIGSEKICLKR